MKRLILISIYLLHNVIAAQSSQIEEVHPRITLERTEIRVLHSEIVGQDYELHISLPYGYAKGNHSYPVIYLLDPSLHFSIMKGLTDLLSSSQTIPQIILVGIGYGGEGFNTRLNFAVGRLRDYTPSQDTAIEEWNENAIKRMGINDINIITGGAPLFLKFFKNELFPFIELNYRIDSKERMLCGNSYGGLFGLYTLFHEPNLFSKYVIGSPSIQYKNGISLDYESNYAKTHRDLKAEVIMGSGGLEKVTAENIKKMANLLNSRNYKNLELNTFVFENESHSTFFPVFITQKLKEIYKKL